MHAAWLPSEALRAVGSRSARVDGEGHLVETIVDEIATAHAEFGSGGATAAPERVLAVSPTAGGGEQGYALGRADGVTTVLAKTPAGLLHGFFHVIRLGEAAFTGDIPVTVHRPVHQRRMLDHWDNVDRH